MSVVQHKHRPGYIFLVSVLSIGAICTATAATLLLLAWSAQQNGLLLTQSAQAYEYAYSCGERALTTLQGNEDYSGDETYTYDYGTCDILPVEGIGNEDRSVCVVGYSGNATRRMEIEIDQILPTVVVNNWREVSSFTSCL